MAVKRPSFLKKLKEQQRRARADEKREARRARKQAKAERGDAPADDIAPMEGPPDAAPEAEDSAAE